MPDKTQTIQIQTPAGTLQASLSTDPNYPGIVINLTRPDTKAQCALALIEYDTAEYGLRTIVWGDAVREDPTDKIQHENISEYFEPEDE